jgi:hypothetical protein
MGKEKNNQEAFTCPVGRFFAEFERPFTEKSKFFKHLNQSRVEFLKAVKSLIDERIEVLEKRQTGKADQKATKIKVE